MARIPGFHPGGPGSIPGVGDSLFHYYLVKYNFFKRIIFKINEIYNWIFANSIIINDRNQPYVKEKSGADMLLPQIDTHT